MIELKEKNYFQVVGHSDDVVVWSVSNNGKVVNGEFYDAPPFEINGLIKIWMEFTKHGWMASVAFAPEVEKMKFFHHQYEIKIDQSQISTYSPRIRVITKNDIVVKGLFNDNISKIKDALNSGLEYNEAEIAYEIIEKCQEKNLLKIVTEGASNE